MCLYVNKEKTLAAPKSGKLIAYKVYKLDSSLSGRPFLCTPAGYGKVFGPGELRAKRANCRTRFAKRRASDHRIGGRAIHVYTRLSEAKQETGGIFSRYRVVPVTCDYRDLIAIGEHSTIPQRAGACFRKVKIAAKDFHKLIPPKTKTKKK